MDAALRTLAMPVSAAPSQGRRPEPAFFPTERQILVHSVVEALLGERAIIMIRGAAGVGKSTVADVLHGRLVGLRWRVIRPVAGRRGPLELQRMIGEAFDIAGGDRMVPGELVKAVEAAPAGPPAAVILDDAQGLPAALFHYLSLIIVLLNRRRKRLSVVLVGALGRWDGLDPAYLEALRQASRTYIVPEFTDGQAADYLQRSVAAASASPRRHLSRRATADLLDQADGIPGRIDALVADALGRRRRRGWRYPMLAGVAAAGVTVAAGFVLGRNLPELAAMFAARPIVAAAPGRAVIPPAGPPELSRVPGAPLSAAARPDATPGAAAPVPLPRPLADAASVQATLLVRAPVSPAATVPAEPLLGMAVAPVPLAPTVADAAIGQSRPPASVSVPQPPAAVAARAPGAAEDEAYPPGPPALVATAPPARVVAPPTMRKGPGLALIAQPGDTMASLYAKVYRGVTPPPYADVAAANRLPLRPGAIVVFPTPPDGWAMR